MKNPDPEDFVEKQEIGDFTSIMANFYRGEVQRAYTWRTRLDRTTNWAILILSVLITWTFSISSRPDELLLFAMLFMSILWMIESRRYRHYNVWRSRIEVLESNFIAKALNPEEEVSSRDWMKTLAEDLKDPHFKIPFWVALAHRLSRIYIWLFSITGILWLGKLVLHPTPAQTMETISSRAAIGTIPGFIVFSFLLFIFILFISMIIVAPQVESRKGKIRADRDVREEWEEKM